MYKKIFLLMTAIFLTFGVFSIVGFAACAPCTDTRTTDCCSANYYAGFEGECYDRSTMFISVNAFKDGCADKGCERMKKEHCDSNDKCVCQCYRCPLSGGSTTMAVDSSIPEFTAMGAGAVGLAGIGYLLYRRRK